MAGFPSSSGSLENSKSTSLTPEAEHVFQNFYTEVKEIEKRDSVLTPKQQIDRLLRPGSTYFNLNPFEGSECGSTNGTSTGAIKSIGECSLSSHQFSRFLLNLNVHFFVLQLKDSLFVWIGAVSQLSELAVALVTRFNPSPITSSLLGDKTDQTSSVVASHLSKRTGKQVFLSYSLDPTDKMLLPLVEQCLYEEIKIHPEKF